MLGKQCGRWLRKPSNQFIELLRKFDEISEKFSEPDVDFDKLLAEQGRLQEQLDQPRCLES